MKTGYNNRVVDFRPMLLNADSHSQNRGLFFGFCKNIEEVALKFGKLRREGKVPNRIPPFWPTIPK